MSLLPKPPRNLLDDVTFPHPADAELVLRGHERLLEDLQNVSQLWGDDGQERLI